MNYERGKWEKEIAESPLFTLDREKEPAAYKRESYKMVEALYCYLLSVDRRRYEPWGCEITETAVRCIQQYDPAKGIFLHYFNAAWKKEYAHLMGRQASVEKFHGMKIQEEDRRNIRKYLKLMERMDPTLSQAAACKRIAEAMGLTEQEVREIAEMADTTVSGDTESGEGISDSLEKRMLDMDAVRELLQSIERVFSGLQARQKPLMSELLTVRIWPALPEDCRDVKVFSFLSADVIEAYRRTGRLPTQRDIAAKYGRKEESVSRTINRFLERVQDTRLLNYR